MESTPKPKVFIARGALHIAFPSSVGVVGVGTGVGELSVECLVLIM